MGVKSVVRPRRGRVVLPLIGLAVSGYFSWHAFHGAHGLLQKPALAREELRLSAELAGLKSHRRRLEQQVDLLRDDALDPDFLEERALELLNFAHPKDRILIVE